MKRKIFCLLSIAALVSAAVLPLSAQGRIDRFEKVKIFVPSGDRFAERDARVVFGETSLRIETTGRPLEVKEFPYSLIRDAEYTYSKNPRWKTGLGLGAASLLFPPLILVALPVGFTKHRRHWLTIRTEDDFAVLRLSKQNRKLLIPAFETRTGVTVRASGESK